MRTIRSLVIVGALLLASSAGLLVAHAAEVCSATDDTFCFSAELAVTAPGTATPENRAGAPADFTFSMGNTSADHLSGNTNHWLGQLGVNLVKGLGGSLARPSAQLDDDLLLAGSSTDCAQGGDNLFAACTAGHGVFVANVSGTGFTDGFHTGTFGVERIVNVNPPADGFTLDWQAVLHICVNTPLGACNAGSPQESIVSIRSGTGAAAGSLVMNTTAVFDYSSAHVDGSLDSLSDVHLLGTSGTLGSGLAAPDGTQTTLHLPFKCGLGNATITGVDRAFAAAMVPLTVNVTGCPTAKLTAQEPSPYTATFNGSGATVGVGGRSIAKWLWTFGDGKHAATTGPQVTHRYATSATRVASLVVQDSAGARSAAVSLTLKGTKLTIASSKHSAHAGDHLTVSGRLTRWNTTKGLASRKLRLERCHKDLTHCALVATFSTSSTGHWSKRTTFSATRPTFRIAFAGGGGYLGTRARTTVKKL